MDLINQSEKDKTYMEQAIRLARRGAGFVNPNPQVGAVIVKNGRIIGQGWHRRFGEPHAERNALASCTEDPAGATLYVTLEPCCHQGKTPPCTEAVIDRRISRVVIGSGDPNPLVSGRGIARLREAGISVTEHCLQKECDALNPVFFHYIRTGLPFVTAKYAMTRDGRIATAGGSSRWITGEAARAHVHHSRGRNMAIMAGLGTILADDPELTCRDSRGLSPVRIICDTELNTPLSSRLVQTAAETGPSLRQPRTVIATAEDSPLRTKPYEELGVKILTLPRGADGHIDLNALVRAVGTMQIDSILLEGGSELNWSALNSGIVNRVQTYIAPKIFGGAKAKGPVGGAGVDSPEHAFMLTDSRITRIGEDYLIESEVELCSQES